jgi:hypothetical protein
MVSQGRKKGGTAAQWTDPSTLASKRLYWQLHQLVFLDESACLPRTGDRKRGWSPVGLPCYDIQLLSRSKRWSVLPAIVIDGYLAEPLITEGGVTMEVKDGHKQAANQASQVI